MQEQKLWVLENSFAYKTDEVFIVLASHRDQVLSAKKDELTLEISIAIWRMRERGFLFCLFVNKQKYPNQYQLGNSVLN